jgi:hypothetical protein
MDQRNVFNADAQTCAHRISSLHGHRYPRADLLSSAQVPPVYL